jgi:hypothetical protein
MGLIHDEMKMKLNSANAATNPLTSRVAPKKKYIKTKMGCFMQ